MLSLGCLFVGLCLFFFPFPTFHRVPHFYCVMFMNNCVGYLYCDIQVEDATKALEATNGMNLEKNGQILRVAYAKSIVGPGSAASGASQSSSLAAAAIEAATFAQQVPFFFFCKHGCYQCQLTSCRCGLARVFCAFADPKMFGI